MCVSTKREGWVPQGSVAASHLKDTVSRHPPPDYSKPPAPPTDLRCTDPAHVKQHNTELGTTALHAVQHMLGTQALLGVLVHGCIHRHHVVHAGQLKAMTGKEEKSINILAQQRHEESHSLWEKREWSSC